MDAEIIRDENKNEALYKRAVRQLRCEINGGTYRSGDRLPTLKILERELCMTLAPIRRALTELEDEGLIVNHHRRGWFVKSVALDSHATQVNDRVGIVYFNPLEDLFWGAVIQSAVEAFSRSGYKTLLYYSEKVMGQREELRIIQELSSETVGLLIASANVLPEGSSLFYQMKNQGFPFAFIDTRPRSLDHTLISSHNQRAGREAIEHLITIAKCKKIYVLADRQEHFPLFERIEGCREGLKKRGQLMNSHDLSDFILNPKDGSRFEKAGRVMAQELVKREKDALLAGKDRIGVLALTDRLAFGAFQFLNDFERHHSQRLFGEKKRLLGGPIALMSFDDVNPMMETLGITSVHQYPSEIGEKSAKMLMKWIAGKHGVERPKDLRIRFDIRARASTVVAWPHL